MRIKNNSSGGIYRSYAGFELAIPGHFEGDIPVPERYQGNVASFLKKHHPMVQVEEQAAITPLPEAATSADTSILDINADEGEGEEQGPVNVPETLTGSDVNVLEVAPVKAAKNTTGLRPAKKSRR